MAVAYDKAFYIGQITAINSHEEMHITFLAHTKDEGLIKWPRQKDCATVHKKYVFSSTPKMQAVGKQFFVHNFPNIKYLYEKYQKTYMKENNQ